MSQTTTNETPSLHTAFEQFKRLLRLIKPYWNPLGKDVAFGVIISMIGIISPYLSKLLIDKVLPNNDVNLMQMIVIGIVAISLASTFFGSLRGYFMLYINSHLNNAISLMFFNHLQHLTTRFFEDHRVGEVMSRFQDVSRSLSTVTRVFQTIFLNGIYLILVPPFLFYLQPKLAIIGLISVPLSIGITAISGRVLRKYWQQTSEAYAELNAFQFEVLSHVRTFKALSLEHYAFDNTRQQMSKAIDLQIKAGGLGQLFGIGSGLVSVLNTAILTWFSWRMILAGTMTLGDYIAFQAYMGYLYNPIRQFIGLFDEFQQAAVHLGRMFEYLDAPVEKNPVSAYQPLPPIETRLQGDIALEGLHFGYSAEKEILHGIDMHIERGKVTALVGPSGSGKTSILRLLVGMESADSGGLYFDGIPVSAIPLADLRRQVAVVWQEINLVKGTIWHNLTLGLDDKTAGLTEKVSEIIRICQLETLILSLPDQYETGIGEWGATLSAGQRQRVAIARALLRDTPILIFDEATANIDMATELAILNEIFRAFNDKTFVFVTHRLSSTRLADQIYLLDDGRIERNGNYKAIFGDQPEPLYQHKNEEALADS